MDMKPLISPAELVNLMNQASVTLIDTRDPEVYAAAHLPGAINIREIFTYLAGSSPEELASLQAQFATLLGEAGISGTEPIVIYEDSMDTGYGQSCRGYFLLTYLGCSQVSVLHGGYQAWVTAGLPTTSEIPTPEAKVFEGNLNPEVMVTTQEMLDALDDPTIVKLDVRDRVEWIGESSSPYGVDFCPRKGRIPGAVWIEWYDLMDSESDVLSFRSPEDILAICKNVGITPDSTVYVYCFKGSRASNSLIALKEAGITQVRNYFASWNEWSRDPALPIETGAPIEAKMPVSA
jgi:thiosulfate/3-mercaptopyruvate sulfurtransferase